MAGAAGIPQWLEPLLDAEQMRATDRWAIEDREIPSLELMERAGTGLARVVEEFAPDGPVAVVCGKGNNGGDGLVAARVLRDIGREVLVFFAGSPDELSGDARQNLERLPGPPPEPLFAGALDDAAIVVDALLGTGSSGEPRGEVRAALEAIEAAEAPAVAADVPSGVDASTGEVAGAAVHAVATATFHAAKPGLWIHPGKAHAGEVRVIDIGIPGAAPAKARAGLLDGRVLELVPRRQVDGTKFASGHVLVAGGSLGLTGAPCLAADAAMRAGAGYVTACVPASLDVIFETRLLEVMTRPLPDAGGALTPEGVDQVIEATGRGGALVLGPGLGRDDGSFGFARDLAVRADIPLVLDADGLNAHAGKLESLAERPAGTILTPHAGELGRLLEIDSDEVQARRLHHAREAASRSGSVVVLKGDDTLVAAPDGFVAVSRGGVPALATAGTGDVLSGVLGAMLAKGLDPFVAAAAGVVLHAAAGRRASERHGSEGMIASDVIEALPLALAG
ncbi:MAG: ADP-dependent NAD(P)H-hydrate dehydratase / NAD(P)H-hydrate epimerase [Solirubrobacteraceae bacterium]|nr:ADP-dependent NAD(P)H-hydrate dehydratase / NAD(P)H-hydrate epimerase [Solirubrobacteraceae bacterium]